MRMRLIDWLRVTDVAGVGTVVIYFYEDDSPVYVGYADNTPYWLAERYVAKDCGEPWEAAISYRSSLGEEHNDKPGWVIVVTDDEKDAYEIRNL